MSEDFCLPGFEMLELIGAGATGEVWRATEVSTGDTVALKRLALDADPRAVEALRREASLLRTLDTPYVVRLRAVVDEGPAAVLVLDHAPGGSLAGLLARRGALDPGEVITIGGPLSQALAAAHAVALVHGDVSPANVLFTAEGMPLLADLGVARVAGERRDSVDGTAEYLDPAVAAGGDPDFASDVWALAALCHHLLAGTPPHSGATVADVLDAAATGSRAPLGLLAPSAPRALVAAIEAGLVADPTQRPDAAAFASLLRRSHAAAPVRLHAGGGPPREPVRPTHEVRVAPPAPPVDRVRRRLPRRALPAAGLVLLVVLAASIGWLSGRGEVPAAVALAPLPPASPAPAPAQAAPAQAAPAQAAPAQAAAEVTPDWSVVLDGLDAARSRAFAAADPAGLSAVWARDTPGLRADTAAVEGLRARGESAHGLRHAVRRLDPIPGEGPAKLEIIDVLGGYEIRDTSGAAVQRVAERGPASWVVELTETPAGWRLLSVTPA